MKKHTFKIVLTISLILIVSSSFSQGIKISNSAGGDPHESAILEIESTTQGLLIPRMTTAQRMSISNSTAGLLVYDTDMNSFFIHSESKWVDLSVSSEIWSQTSNNVYLTNSLKNVGIGTLMPSGKFVIQADPGKADSDPLFEVKDKSGNTIFSVTSEGARMYVKDYDASKGVSGGFAVGKYGIAKGLPDTTLFFVSSDSTRVYSTAAGVSGGFAVGKYGIAKGLSKTIFYTNSDSTRIYTDESNKAVSGGFAIGKYGIAKGVDSLYFIATTDSTRVYTKIEEKGVSGGFAVGKYGIAKGPADNYMHMTKNNYLIGHGSGQSMTPAGLFNVFLGYESGIENTTGSSNVFSGYRSGYSNITGGQNVFSGYTAGYSNLSGTMNAFTGYQSGYSNTTGSFNSFYGAFSGGINEAGDYNVCIGYSSGYYNDSSDFNVFMGYRAGYKHFGEDNDNNIYIGSYAGFGGPSGDTGHNNVYLGNETGYGNTTGNENVFIGYQAGYSNDVGYSNVFVGEVAGYSNTSGSANLFLGRYAGNSNTTANSNVFVGPFAGRDFSTGSFNTCLGRSAGGTNNTGESNVFVGYSAGVMNNGSYNVFIGHLAGGTEAGSDRLYIDNSNTSSPLIYGNFFTNFLRFNAFVDISPTSGDLILQAKGNEAIWYDGTYFSWGYGATYNYFADKVGIGIIDPTYKFELPNIASNTLGRGRANRWDTYSDERIKQNQKTISYGLSEIMKLLPKEYVQHSSKFENEKLKLLDHSEKTIGFIAQDVYLIIPEAVSKPDDENKDLWSMDYEKLIPVLIKGMQEQQAEIEKLKKENQEIRELLQK